MVTKTAFLTAIAFSALCSTAQALYSVADKGAWPESWPKELEPLRKQSRTFVGPVAPQPHYEIPFTNREEFESAWPKLLKVKSQGVARLSGTWSHEPRRNQGGCLDPLSPSADGESGLARSAARGRS